MEELNSSFTVELTFRKMDAANELVCDYCESTRKVVWYNELFVTGLCERCAVELLDEYMKRGGA